MTNIDLKLSPYLHGEELPNRVLHLPRELPGIQEADQHFPSSFHRTQGRRCRRVMIVFHRLQLPENLGRDPANFPKVRLKDHGRKMGLRPARRQSGSKLSELKASRTLCRLLVRRNVPSLLLRRKHKFFLKQEDFHQRRRKYFFGIATDTSKP